MAIVDQDVSEKLKLEIIQERTNDDREETGTRSNGFKRSLIIAPQYATPVKSEPYKLTPAASEGNLSNISMTSDMKNKVVAARAKRDHEEADRKKIKEQK